MASMVVISAPANVLICFVQERMAFPFSSTVQAPQSAMPQPNFVPVNPRMSRKYQSSGISGSPSNVRAEPFTFKLTIGSPRGRSGNLGTETLYCWMVSACWPMPGGSAHLFHADNRSFSECLLQHYRMATLLLGERSD